MSKVSTPTTSLPSTKASTPVPGAPSNLNPNPSSAWSRGPPPAANNSDSQSGTQTPILSSASPIPQAGFAKPSPPNGVSGNGNAVNGNQNGTAPVAIGGHSRKGSIMAIGGGMDIKPRGNLAFGTVDSPNPLLSSSPAAPSITGTHLADAVKSFGSVEADSSTAGAAIVKPPRRTSALNSPASPAETNAAPAKKLDLHALFGAKPPITPAGTMSPPSISATPSSIGGASMGDRRQSMSQSSSFQGSNGLPNSSSHPYQSQMGGIPQMTGPQSHLRAPQTGGIMLGQSPRSPVLAHNLPPSFNPSTQIQQGFRPQQGQQGTMQNPTSPGSQQVRPNGMNGPQGLQPAVMQQRQQGMMMGQGMGQYGMHPGQQGGPVYPMGYGGQPGYYGYNMYDQPQHPYAMPQQWNPQQQSQGQGYNMPMSPRVAGQNPTPIQPSPSPHNAGLPGSGGPSPLPTPPTRPGTLINGPTTSSSSIPSVIPATPARPMQPGSSFSSMQSPQTPAHLAALSAGAVAFTPRKSTIVKLSRPDGTALSLADVAAAAKGPAVSGASSGGNTPDLAGEPTAKPAETTPAPKKMLPTLPIVVRMESEEAKKARLEEESRKERIRKEEEKEEQERKERKARAAAEAEEKQKKEAAEKAEKAKAEAEAAAEAERVKMAEALAAEEIAAKKASEEKEAAAKLEKEELAQKQKATVEAEAAAAYAAAEEAKLKADDLRRALLTPVASTPSSPLASPALAAAGLPAKPVLAINGAARRAVPAALDLSTTATSSPTLTDDSPSASMSALGTARPIEDIKNVVYPSSIKPPSPDLNITAPPGKYRYDRDFLMQFMDVCREKPENLPPLEAIGLEADPTSGFGASRGGARSRSSMGPPSGRAAGNAITGLGIGMGQRAFPQGMGNFNLSGPGSISRPATSEERYNRSLQAGAGRNASGRTPSQSGPSQLPGMHGLPPMGGSQSRSGGNRSGRGTKRMPQEPRGGYPTEPDVAPLVITNNAWVNARSGTTDEKSPAYIERKVKALLNKLTAEKFDSISTQILEWANKSRFETDGMTLKLVIKLVFEKATDEAHWSAMYAKLCRMLLDRLDPAVTEVLDGKEVSGGSLFRKYLLGRCQMDFEAGWRAREEAASAAAAKHEEDKERLAKHAEAKDKEEEAGEPILLSDEYYAAQKAKRRGLGLVQLIGELFKLDMLSKGVIRNCLIKLLGNMENPDEEDLESTCKLLTTVGESFEAQAAESMNVIFERLITISTNEHVSSRIRFMILDVIDLRKSGWRARNQQAGVMTIAEIHQRAAQEKAQATAAAAQSQRESISRGGSRSGHSRGGPQPGEWQSVATGSRPPQRPTDFSNIGRNLSSSSTTLSFGPSSVFQKGRKPGPTGPAGVVTPPLSRQASTSNMFGKFGVLDEAGDGAPAAAIEAEVPQRKRLNLAPRSKPLPGEEGEDEDDGERSEEDAAVPETPAVGVSMSADAAKIKIASDVKELWGEKDAGGSRNPEDIVDYFRALPAEHQGLLAEQLVNDLFRISKIKDVEVVAKGWKAALEGEVTTLDALKKGLDTRMPSLDDDAIDFPQAYRAIAILFRSLSLSPKDIDELVGKIDVYGEPKITPKMKLDREFTKLEEEAAKA